eukprot:TRINITY_DN15941_c0_g1_i3.p1 TRINITY_DN15941_c0_g1~~TRINITY_DN15941_c0_g1_i3.p1  ORF type:complete len:113 (+),score=24.66 TRINITY_DN15941_c0_g1_i3:105-443(+)
MCIRDRKSLEDGLTTARVALKTGGKFLCGSFVRSDRMEADLERVPSLYGFELGSVSIPASEKGWSTVHGEATEDDLSLIHISEPTRLLSISYAVFCLKKKTTTTESHVCDLT